MGLTLQAMGAGKVWGGIEMSSIQSHIYLGTFIVWSSSTLLFGDIA